MVTNILVHSKMDKYMVLVLIPIKMVNKYKENGIWVC